MLIRPSSTVFCVVLSALACGSATSREQPPAVPDVPRRGGTVTIEEGNDPYNFDLSIAGTSRGNLHATALAYESLLRFKTGPDVDYTALELEPALAERWEVTPDGKAYTFHLRKGLRFPDLSPVNGRELTSKDVKFSYEYWSRTGEFKDKDLPRGQFTSYFQGVEGIEAPDPLRVVVRFERSFAPFLSYVGAYNNPILAREIYDLDGHFKDRILGAGGFQLDMAASQKGSRWLWKKNANYWEEGKPYVDQLRWLVLPDEATIQAAFKTKQLDVIKNIGLQAAEQVKGDNADAVLHPHRSLAAQTIYMNQRRPPLTDGRIRRAIALAVDRDEFIRIFSKGQGTWALSGAFPDTYSQEEIKQILRYDPQEAKRLLAEAGFSQGLDLEHLFPGNSFGETYLQEMQLFQAQMKKLGINLSLKSLDLGDYLQRTRRDSFDLTLRGTAVQADVDSYLYLSYHPSSPRNYNGVDDPALTAMLEAQRAEPDPRKRREIVRQAVRYIADNALGLATYTAVTYDLWHLHLKDYAPHASLGSAWPLESAWLDK